MTVAGRIILGLPFGVFGIIHMLNGPTMAAYVPAFIPGPGALWVYVTGVILLASSLAILSNRYVFQAGIALACLMGIFVLTIHIPGVMNPEGMQMAMGQLLKDTALGGGALTLAAYSRKRI